CALPICSSAAARKAPAWACPSPRPSSRTTTASSKWTVRRVAPALPSRSPSVPKVAMMTAKDLIWIVDDDRSIRWVLEKSLDKAGFQSQSFDSGDSVLEELRHGQPDAIITDIRMPGTDGLEVLKQIHEHYPALPVIIMTAHSDLS